MSNLNIQPFDTQCPYKSIAKFTNKYTLLLDEDKEKFINDLEIFFSERAYNDRTHPMPADFRKRFVEFDVPTLHAVTKQLAISEGTFRGDRLIANIAKVADIALGSSEDPRSIYQVKVFDKDDSEKLKYWGWIPSQYVTSSEGLTKHIQNGHIVMEEEAIKPSVLLALHRILNSQRNEAKKEIRIDLSFDALLDLVVSANEWKGKDILNNLEHDFQGKFDDEDRKEEFIRAMKRQDETKLSASFDELEKKIQKAREDKRQEVTLTLPHYKNGGESRWFNEEAPYGSIVQFTARSCALSKEEQLRFYSAVRRFFTIAYDDKVVEIPKTLERQFAQVALPFLLGTMQHEQPERERLFACIQLVANRNFPQLQSQ